MHLIKPMHLTQIKDSSVVSNIHTMICLGTSVLDIHILDLLITLFYCFKANTFFLCIIPINKVYAKKKKSCDVYENSRGKVFSQRYTSSNHYIKTTF